MSSFNNSSILSTTMTTTMTVKPTDTENRQANVRIPCRSTPCTRPAVAIDWLDANPAVRAAVIRMVVSRCRVAPSDAEDLVMDSVVKLHQLQPDVRNPKALLFTVAMNSLRSKRRTLDIKTRNRVCVRDCHTGTTGLDSLESPELGGLARLEAIESQMLRRQMIGDGLGRLSATDREILTAYYFEGRSLMSIDLERGDRIGVAKVRLYRARQRLLRLLAVEFTLRFAA